MINLSYQISYFFTKNIFIKDIFIKYRIHKFYNHKLYSHSLNDFYSISSLFLLFGGLF